MGDSGRRQVDPHAKLIYNDNKVEGAGLPNGRSLKSDAMYDLLKGKSRAAPAQTPSISEGISSALDVRGGLEAGVGPVPIESPARAGCGRNHTLCMFSWIDPRYALSSSCVYVGDIGGESQSGSDVLCEIPREVRGGTGRQDSSAWR